MSGAPIDPQLVRVFPLDGAVLLPGALLPLHIFEPRYRQMVEDALAGDQRIAMAMPLEDERVGAPPPEIAATIGIGRIVANKKFDDGRYHIVLEGESRARVQAEAKTGGPYRTVVVTVLQDDPLVDAEGLEGGVVSIKALLNELLKLLPDNGRELGENVGKAQSPGHMVDVLADAVVTECADRQTLLETTDVLARIEIVQRHLANLLVALRGSRAAN